MSITQIFISLLFFHFFHFFFLLSLKHLIIMVGISKPLSLLLQFHQSPIFPFFFPISVFKSPRYIYFAHTFSYVFQACLVGFRFHASLASFSVSSYSCRFFLVVTIEMFSIVVVAVTGLIVAVAFFINFFTLMEKTFAISRKFIPAKYLIQQHL